MSLSQELLQVEALRENVFNDQPSVSIDEFSQARKDAIAFGSSPVDSDFANQIWNHITINRGLAALPKD